MVLEEKGIVEIIEGNKFKITNLPSSIMSCQFNSGTKE
ncbi:putative lipoprotein [Prevotella sp. ICM33]|nr:putative lipoprotein [Prevotella sp. ICM33]